MVQPSLAASSSLAGFLCSAMLQARTGGRASALLLSSSLVRSSFSCSIGQSEHPAVVRKSLRKSVPSEGWKAVPEIWRSSTEKYGHRVALVDLRHDPPSRLTYTQVEQSVLEFAKGLRALGAQPGQHIALFAENSCRWLVADQGIMAMGAANAVRGSRSSVEELLYIYEHSDSVALVVDNSELLERLWPGLQNTSSLSFIIVLWGSKHLQTVHVPVYTYEELLSLGKHVKEDQSAEHSEEFIQPDDVATVVYTSGTTGKPKGVVLSHANLLHQIHHLIQCIQPSPGDRFLSLLPPWHAYERAAEYFTFTRGIEQVYTNVKNLKDDFKLYPAQYFVSVPLVYETMYSGIQRQILKASLARRAFILGMLWLSYRYMELKRFSEGTSILHAKDAPGVRPEMACMLARSVASALLPFHLLAEKLVYTKMRAAIGIEKTGISGGGSLPSHVDRFFEAIGVTLLNGYGLTETSPVVATRALPDNVLGTVGRPLKHTEVKVVDPEIKNEVKFGVKGLVMVRGPQVMKGYYKNEKATAQALDDSGWLDTGDLGWIAPQWKTGPARKCGGMLVLEGRAKDTIVLLTGENVEPAEIEEAALQSELIHQIMVIGQDQRRLGALVVPNKEATAGKSKAETISAIRRELNRCLARCAYQIPQFALVEEGFTIENGLLTPTMKLKRDVILSKYESEAASVFASPDARAQQH